MIRHHIHEAEYHALPGESSSKLAKILRSPLHYQHAVRTPSEDTASLAFGRALHCAVLEPDRFAAEYTVADHRDGMTPAEKSAATKAAKATGLVVVAPEVLTMAAAIKAHPDVAELLAAWPCEVSAFWTDFDTGIDCRARADILSETAIYDIKTTEDASPDAFRRSLVQWDYAFKAAFYADGFEAADGKRRKFFWIAVEKKPPYAVGIYCASPSVIAAGRALATKALRTLKQCREADQWPSYESQIIDMPGGYRGEEEQ